MPRKAWADFQKWVARRVKGRVIPRTHYGDSVPDVVSDGFLWECKRMKRIPVGVVKAVEQARGYCKGNYADLTPVAVFGEPYYKRVIVAMDFRDFLDILGENERLRQRWRELSAEHIWNELGLDIDQCRKCGGKIESPPYEFYYLIDDTRAIVLCAECFEKEKRENPPE